jgi:putative MFS transporter
MLDETAIGSAAKQQLGERNWIICGAAFAIGAFQMAFSQFTNPVLLILCGVMITVANMTMSYAYHAYQTGVFPTPVRARPRGWSIP